MVKCSVSAKLMQGIFNAAFNVVALAADLVHISPICPIEVVRHTHSIFSVQKINIFLSLQHVEIAYGGGINQEFSCILR